VILQTASETCRARSDDQSVLTCCVCVGRAASSLSKNSRNHCECCEKVQGRGAVWQARWSGESRVWKELAVDTRLEKARTRKVGARWSKRLSA
jgi:hypothetical protein